VARAEIRGVKLSYLKLGDWESGKPPLLLVHGLATSSGFWMRASERLAAEVPLLIYDLRGHGRSGMTPSGYTPAEQAEDLLALLDVAEVDRCFVAGHSFGGSVLLHAAIRQPARFLGITLADTRLRLFQSSLTPCEWPQWPERQRQLREIGIELADDQKEAGIVLLTELARLQVHGREEIGEVPRWLKEFHGQAPSKRMAGRWLDLMDTTHAFEEFQQEQELGIDQLEMLSEGMLAIYGAESPILPSGQALKEACPRVYLRIAPEAGHFFPAFRPGQFVRPLLHQLAALGSGV